MTFIRGDLFQELADFTYTDPSCAWDLEKFPHTFSKEAVKAFNGTPIIFTLTWNIGSLFPLLASVNKRVVLSTHISDCCTDGPMYATLPPNVIRWFAPNINYKGERLESVPLGLETLKRFDQFHHIHKIEKMEAKCQEEKTLKNLLYICHSSHQANVADREESYTLRIGSAPFGPPSPTTHFR